MGPKSNVPEAAKKDGIIADNPEKFYTFGDVIGEGKFAQVKHAQHKTSGDKFAAKIIRYDSDTLKFAVREFDFMKELNMDHAGLVKLHEAYVVQKYIILIVECADGPTLLDQISKRHTLNEDVVAGYVRTLCETLAYMHSNNALHLDLRPTNIRFNSSNQMKLVDYNSCRIIANKKAGAVVDVIGDTEFCAPEMLDFDPVMPESDIWSVAILTFIMLTGVSPFFYEDEDEVVNHVKTAKCENWNIDELSKVSSEAVDFMKKILIRAPENRLTAAKCLEHKWLSEDYAGVRKKNSLDCQDVIAETDQRLCEEEEEDYIYASFKLRTFDEEENVTTELSEEE
jgi:serine/threonine protein kinase